MGGADGLSDIESVVVDLSSIGATKLDLTEDWCIYPEDGLYCGTVHAHGDVETGDKILTGSLGISVVAPR